MSLGIITALTANRAARNQRQNRLQRSRYASTLERRRRAMEQMRLNNLRDNVRQTLYTINNGINTAKQQLLKLQNELKLANECEMKFKEERKNESIKIFAVLGKKENEKTMFCNRLAKDKNVTVINVSESDEISLLQGLPGVNCFVIFRNGKDYKFDENEKEMLEVFEDILGEEFWEHCIIVSSKTDDISIAGKETLEKEIRKEFELTDETVELPLVNYNSGNYENCIENIKLKCLDYRLEFESETNDIQNSINEWKEVLNDFMEKRNEAENKMHSLY